MSNTTHLRPTLLRGWPGSFEVRHHGCQRFHGSVGDAKNVSVALLTRFWAAGFPHMEYLAVGTPGLDGHSVLAFELRA